MFAKNEALSARFFSKVVTLEGGCHYWTGEKQKGYGVFYAGGKKYRAHRAALYLVGTSIPEGLVVDHTCRNRACVNVNHLRVVTAKVNALENSNSFGAVNKLKTHCSRGHPFSKLNTRERVRPKKKCVERACRTCDKERKRGNKV